MFERAWLVLASVAPLVLGCAIPLILIAARRSRIKAQAAQTEVLGLKRQLSDNQKN